MMELSRLQWRCRRGLAELDELLSRFLEYGYAELDACQRRRFEQLLEYPDQVLLDYLMLRMISMDGETTHVIHCIRAALARST